MRNVHTVDGRAAKEVEMSRYPERSGLRLFLYALLWILLLNGGFKLAEGSTKVDVGTSLSWTTSTFNNGTGEQLASNDSTLSSLTHNNATTQLTTANNNTQFTTETTANRTEFTSVQPTTDNSTNFTTDNRTEFTSVQPTTTNSSVSFTTETTEKRTEFTSVQPTTTNISTSFTVGTTENRTKSTAVSEKSTSSPTETTFTSEPLSATFLTESTIQITTKPAENSSPVLSGGEIAAIVICSTIAFVVVASSVFMILRHRRKHARYEHFDMESAQSY